MGKCFLLILSLSLISACKQEQDTPDTVSVDTTTARRSSFDAAAADVELSGTPVNVAGITFRSPKDWKELGPSGMRAATYIFGPIGSDKDSAMVVAFFFGPQQGGSVEQNMMRWVGQMQSSGDATSPVYDTLTVNSLPVYTVEVNGTYAPSPMGQPAGTDISPREGYHLAAVIVQSPEGSVFFRLTGPEATAREMSKGLVAMIRGITTTP